MKHTLKALVYLCLFTLSGQLYAQTSTTYQSKAGNFALAFNGTVEKGYRVGYVSTPYYPQEYTPGSFVYRGVEYTDVKLRTDSYTGRLLVLSPDGKFNRVMPPQEVRRATIGEIPFVYFQAQEAAPGEGYYAVIHEGKDFAIYKQSYVSNINKVYRGSLMLQDFSLKERLFLVKDGSWSPLTNKSSFIKHFKPYKDALNAYCKNQQVNPSKKNEADWQKLAAYCETLIK